VYVPILRWKQGGQHALAQVAAAERLHMLPVAELQELEAAPYPRLTQTLTSAAAGVYPVGVDLKAAYAPGPVNFAVLADYLTALQAAGLHAWPTLHAADVQANLPGLTFFSGQQRAIVRISPAQTSLAAAPGLLASCALAMGPAARLVVVIDLGCLVDAVIGTEAAVATAYAQAIATLPSILAVAVAGGSFPWSLQGLPLGATTYLLRKELEIWKIVRQQTGCVQTLFGDYGVTNPKPLGNADPRTMNPSAAIRYTRRNDWWLLRASGVKTPGRGGFSQYNPLCQLLISSPDYSGPSFSFGDEKYEYHANTPAKSGNLTTWRRDATNHHLVLTQRQLAAGDY
jgi:hypothetical protein